MIKFIDIVSKLFHSRIQIHLAHLQTTSYAKHKALDGFYKDIVELTDELIETYQGKTRSVLKNYKSYPLVDDIEVINYLDYLKKDIESFRKTLDFSMDNINNQLQVIIDLIDSTTYLLSLQ